MALKHITWIYGNVLNTDVSVLNQYGSKVYTKIHQLSTITLQLRKILTAQILNINNNTFLYTCSDFLRVFVPRLFFCSSSVFSTVVPERMRHSFRVTVWAVAAVAIALKVFRPLNFSWERVLVWKSRFDHTRILWNLQIRVRVGRSLFQDWVTVRQAFHIIDVLSILDNRRLGAWLVGYFCGCGYYGLQCCWGSRCRSCVPTWVVTVVVVVVGIGWQLSVVSSLPIGTFTKNLLPAMMLSCSFCVAPLMAA